MRYSNEKVKSLQLAMDEAKRFLAAAEKMLDAYATRKGYGCEVEFGRVKRASLDLTRALAAFRKTNV